jgi:hypothetical protein
VTGAPVLAEVFAVVLAAALLRIGWLQLQFARRGYRARLDGRDNVLYEERDLTGMLQRVVLEGEMLVRGPHVLYVPDDLNWNESMPAWLHGRRQQVLDRIAKAIGALALEARKPSRPQNNKMQQTRHG